MKVFNEGFFCLELLPFFVKLQSYVIDFVQSLWTCSPSKSHENRVTSLTFDRSRAIMELGFVFDQVLLNWNNITKNEKLSVFF